MMESLLMDVTLAVSLFLAPYFIACPLRFLFRLKLPVVAGKHKAFRGLFKG